MYEEAKPFSKTPCHIHCFPFQDSSGKIGLIPGSENRGKGMTRPVLLTLYKNAGEIVEARIIKIASGSNHLVMLADDGHIYSCGTGEQGQLGRQMPRSSGRRTLGPVLAGDGMNMISLANNAV